MKDSKRDTKFKHSNNFFLKYIFIISIFFFISTNANAQSVVDQVAVANNNRIYSAAEVGDYRNHCEYGEQEFFIPDRNRFLINIDNKKATTGNMILGCWPLSYNSNGVFYNYIKMDLLPGVTECPRIDLTEAFPVGTPTNIYNFMNLTPQSYYHRSAAAVYIPRMNLAFSKGNSCYYSHGAQSYPYGGDKKEYMSYFFINANQFKDFVKGDKYVERYASRFVPGASWEGAEVEESTQTFYNLPSMQLASYQTSDKYSTETDLNMNKGKYMATSTRNLSGKQELNNVIFFPGLLGSQLQNSHTNQIIWPSITKDIHSNMKVVNPESIRAYSLSYPFSSNVYTYNDTKSKQDGGVLRNYFLSTNGGTKINTVDIYDSFLTELDKLKTSNEMRDYAAIPYDFRMFTDDVYCSSNIAGVDKVSYDTQSHGAHNSWPWDCRNGYIYGEMKRLALTSKTGKITLIGHSYGGLVMKEILKHLEETNDSLLSKIDKVILVAVPQGGAPDSVQSILHGKALGHGLIVDSSTSKSMLATFPSMYQLLPNDKLIKSGNPLVTFTPKVLDGVINDKAADYDSYIKAYGNDINNTNELYSFLLNKTRSIRSTTSNTVLPGNVYENLLNYSKTRKEMLDNYVPTSTIEVHQIAGWGIPTPSGYTYDRTKYCNKYAKTNDAFGSEVYDHSNCLEYRYRPIQRLALVFDGDDTVPATSALWMSTTTNSNVHNWWVDLGGYNKLNLLKGRLDRSHKDILASLSMKDFVVGILRNRKIDIKYISKDKSIPNTVTYLGYTLHSPATITITDSNGNISGYSASSSSQLSDIPGVYEFVFGDTHTVLVPENINHIVTLTGYASSTYALDVNRVDGTGNTVSSTTYYSIPTAPSSLSYLKHDVLATSTDALILDYNHNGKADAILITGGTYTASSTLPDTTPISDYLYYTSATTSPPKLGAPKTLPRPAPRRPL